MSNKKGALVDFRDWAHLPPEIVESISEKVKSITDLARFRSVCSPWRSATFPKPRHLPPQLPWLMLQCHTNCYDGNRIHFFYDVWESKMREIHLPETISMTCSGSYRGWLLLTSTRGKHVFFLNPLTRVRIQLPPFPSFEGTFDFGKSKVTFSTNLTDPNCLIMMLLDRYRVMCCRVGDRHWRRVYSRSNSIADMMDATYYNGRFYFLYEKSMQIIEPNQPEKTILLHQPELTTVGKCFVEGKSGVYVLAIHPEGKFELYQFQEKTTELNHITETSDNTAIFYGDCFPRFAVHNYDWDSLDGGSVYVEYQCIPYAWKRAVRSGYSKYSAGPAEGKDFVLCDLVKEPRFRPVEPAMWFQPSFH
ncbi:F-box family protein [Rhynchospora pubera]|uniref:F-box family protein n=1 Tax=Rhynchospora pubera TaxID=906938 RepID=A0AAV8GMZ6_9POAL|nr:F-box family protein [Rhynchospora pubera]